jgi:hypothetical protein
MDEPTHDSTPHFPNESNYTPSRRSAITKAGGALGIAATLTGLAIFLAGCAGYDAAFKFSLIPLLLAVAGLLMTLLGGVLHQLHDVEDSHVVASICLNLASIVGALILIAIWKGVPIFVA